MNKITCNTCNGLGYIELNINFPRVALVVCTCGHGGKAWHVNVFGRCSFPNCSCVKVSVVSAIITRHTQTNSKDYSKTIDGNEFNQYYKENKGMIIFV